MSKLYVWVNSKLTPIQKGIQASHVVRDLVENWILNTNDDQAARELAVDWIRYGRTIVVLEGGTHAQLYAFLDFVEQMPDGVSYPSSYWQEPDINDAMAGVGIVLGQEFDSENRVALLSTNIDDWQKGLINKLITSREAV